MECNSFCEWVELEEYSMYPVYSTSKSAVAGIVVIDLHDFGLLFLNRMIFISFELEKVEFRMFIPVIPLLKSLKKNCSLRFAPDLLF